MKIKILFDKEKEMQSLNIGWGASYLIDESVLFDTAEKGQYLMHNINELGVDISKIEKVVISHNHWDHTGGIESLLKVKNDIEIYACRDFIAEFKEKLPQADFKEVKVFQEIDKDIYTTGCMTVSYKGENIYEQALICKTKKGITVICGCAHPGVLEILNKAKEHFPKEKVFLLLGGFHLINREKRIIDYIVDELKKSGVVKVGPSHCSGFEAASALYKRYGRDCIDIKAGTELDI
jgi:7,8-dihydropterin-6-yl-methyl-4-(beta-D-ribofuranosyl)aminobenzene 5'-phosphate synthase